MNRHALAGLQIAYDSARSYEDKCWYGFLIEVCHRNTIAAENQSKNVLYVN